MRYRKLDAAGDYVFGQGQSNFYVDQPEAAAQAVQTRLLLVTGEWFLDVTEGTPYSTQILGKDTVPLYDAAIKQRILGTSGIVDGSLQPVISGIPEYSSSLVGQTRALSVGATLTTIFSETTIALAASVSPPIPPAPPPASGGVLDFSDPANSALLGAI